MESMATRILLLVANARPAGDAAATLAHAWRTLDDAGCEVLLVSPEGGAAHVDDSDATASGWAGDVARRALLARTAAPAQVDAGDFDAVVCLASGASGADEVHASGGIERIVRSVDAHGGVVAAAGHVDCALVALVGQRQDDADAADVARTVVRRLAG